MIDMAVTVVADMHVAPNVFDVRFCNIFPI